MTNTSGQEQVSGPMGPEALPSWGWLAAGATLTKERLLGVLQEAIGNGALAPGERLPTERAIAARAGLSRATVRDALARLAQQGFIHRQVGRGTFVGGPQFAPATTELGVMLPGPAPSPAELIQFRGECEPALVDLIVMNASDAELQRIRALVWQGRTAQTWQVCEDIDAGFHLALFEATQNRIFAEIGRYIRSIRRGNVWQTLKRQNFSQATWSRNQAEHEEIVEHLVARDIKRAREAIRAHLGGVRAWAGRRDV
jgi:GntR family transcriptional regulator, uxu operon transcriptional repressor